MSPDTPSFLPQQGQEGVAPLFSTGEGELLEGPQALAVVEGVVEPEEPRMSWKITTWSLWTRKS